MKRLRHIFIFMGYIYVSVSTDSATTNQSEPTTASNTNSTGVTTTKPSSGEECSGSYELCGENEIPTTCFEAICERRDCSDLGQPIKCVRIDSRFCTKGCLCKDTYLRAENGECIPENLCPNAQCGKNEIYDDCVPDDLTETCGAEEAIIVCSMETALEMVLDAPSCSPGCRCRENYFRDEFGCCVPKEQCPPSPGVICGPDEVPVDCINGGCGFWYCAQTSEICLLPGEGICEEGCRCRDGLLRADDGRCVPAHQCPAKCDGPYEYFSCGGACDNVCATLSKQNQTNCPIVNIKCNPMCYCEEGCARDDNNICVPINECPPLICCGQNEISGCKDSCPQTCESINQKCDCSDETDICIPECRCKDGFYRNKIGECISKANCLQCSGPHEYYSCGGACDNVCATLHKQNQTHCPIKNIACNKKCYCEKGYARDKNNICVPISKCPSVCGMNEVYDTCIAACPPRRCDVDERLIKCTAPLQPGDPKCQAGCRCADNFYRNDKNVCVPRNECPLVCRGQNEVAGCRNACPQTCESINHKCDIIQPAICIPECRCKDGFYRNKLGECISKAHCSVCGMNEVYDTCIAACPPRRCDVDERLIKCTAPLQPGDPKCQAGCRCADNFYRNDKNVCVPRNECPLVCRGQNEVAGCRNACPQTCESINHKCDIIQPAICIPECRCKDGFYRNKLGECISKAHCSVCGMNEVYDTCIAACPPRRCDVDERLIKCTAPLQPGDPKCQAGCRCADNFYRNDKNVCVPRNECPLVCRGQNEVAGCRNACPQTCESINHKCDIIQPAICIPECRCKDGFYRNKLGECISKAHCSVCGMNEVYDTCIAACPPRRCDVDERLIKCTAPLQPGDPKCQAGCRCADNFYRNDKNVCVPRNECPLVCRGQNEVAGCRNACPQTCESINHKCDIIQPAICIPECRCKDGFYRNKLGECISKAHCLKCTGPNEYFSCGGACDNVCATLHKINQTHCPIINIVCNQKCYCEKGYARDKNNICVPISKCPPVCGINEVYDTCIATCPPRRCDVDERLILCVQPLKPGDPKCQAGCRCADNFYRNDKNVCVPRNECPLVCRGQNEVAGCRNACPQTCESINHKCDIIQPAICIPECRCKDGFFRNKIGDCISKENCLKCVGPNEYYSCGGACDNICATLHEQNQTHCPIVNIVCNPMCYCEKGYARDNNNICVPIPKCPPKCNGPHEYFACRGACDNVCATLSLQNQTHCPIINKKCNSMCYCQEGYARDDKNICVPIKLCPVKHCGKNEVVGCHSTCPQTCESIGKPVPCPLQPFCKPECRCKEGFYRNKIGECISKEDCLKLPGVICKDNEVYSSCVNSGCGRWNCSQSTITCINLEKKDCKEGCHCKDGLLRADNGTCVPADQCPHTCCGKNEVIGCHSTCPQTCESIGKRYHCPLQSVDCKPECRCKEGFFRNKIGECISEKDCLKCTGPHEYFSCGGACDNVCSTLHEQNQTHCPIINVVCNPKCYCEKGYARDNNNTCVPISECPPKPCGKNEVIGCHSTCPQTCESIGKIYSCPMQPAGCEPVCRCKPGFYRNKIGECISKEDCLKCTGPNEYFSCGGACDNVCATLPKQNQTNCPIKTFVCQKMCYCESGYARAENNTCVPISKCPLKCYGQNEVSGCQSICPLQTCESIGKIVFCPRQPTECTPECRCKTDFYRNKIGECISKDDCLKCTGPNEYFSCGVACDNVCATLHKQNQTNCPIETFACQKMCYCESGYARAKNNTCVPISKCPPVCGYNEVYDNCPSTCPPKTCDAVGKTFKCKVPLKPGDPDCKPGCRCADGYYRNKYGFCVLKKHCPKPPGVICGNNEEYSSCVNGGCGRWNCSQPGIICKNLIEGGCREGCRCKIGFLRADNGTCIPENQCPLNCYGQNEVSGCKSCPPQTCESIGKRYFCPLQTAECKPECRCKKDYYRNKIGECISKDDCLKCAGPNEYFSCGGACDNVCATLHKENQTNCPIKPYVCVKRCYCEKGYARNNSNICVPISRCPPVCGTNEVYDDCPSTCPKTCDSIGKPCKCEELKSGDPNCKPGCRCADGYYRKKDGCCVLKKDCPKPPVICGVDEEYSSCVNGGCGRWNCSQPGEICIKLPEGGCREGCHCKKGYLRADDGTCVPEDKCPLKCYGKNEVSACHVICPPQTCESISFNHILCPRIVVPCKLECRCKEGFYRNKIGECISKDDCLKCTGPNEYFSCGGACDNVCATLHRENQTNCPIKPHVCLKKCYCEKGYARNNSNICVPISQCPPVCGTNEVYDDCPSTCPKTCDSIGKPCKCEELKSGDPNCKPGCRCADGYYRKKDGCCVLKKDCPKPPVICGVDEEYSSCVNGGCGRWNCSQPGEICIKLPEGGCREGCHCKKGYLRADDGTCVPEDKCPLKCYGKNEVRACNIPCPPQTCESLSVKHHFCPGIVIPCKLVCRCKEGYYRNKIDECISKDDCLKCTGPNEYFSCGVACDNVCATLHKQNQKNCPIKKSECQKMCYCESGYARASNNTCVPIKDCPQTPKCKNNEVYDMCPRKCPPQTCNADPTVICKFSELCEPGCRCIDDYLRNERGDCVPKDKCPGNDKNALEKFDQGNVIFTDKFLNELSKQNPGVSLICSPFSVLFLLAQLALYATGESLKQLLGLLNLSAKTEIRSLMPNYLDELNSQRNVSFSLAERIYGNIQYKFLESFETDIRVIFKAQPQSLDFCKQSQSAATINEWVANQTHNLIQDLVSPSVLSCDTVLVLVNAIYFKGDWLYPFDPKNTIKEDFYVNKDKNVIVNMMKQTKSFKYGEMNDAQVIELPYKSENYSLMVWLPKNKDGIMDLIDIMAKPSFSLNNSLSSLKYQRVALSLPSFKTSTTINLKNMLMQVNVTDIFNAETSGLTGIIEGSKKLFVSSAIQKAYIEVDELGSTAAAANAVIVGTTAVMQQPPIAFLANHPFVHLILFQGTPIFCGSYYGF